MKMDLIIGLICELLKKECFDCFQVKTYMYFPWEACTDAVNGFAQQQQLATDTSLTAATPGVMKR